jgi:hypothetical protein
MIGRNFHNLKFLRFLFTITPSNNKFWDLIFFYNIGRILNIINQCKRQKYLLLVERGGFEPPKAEPADLQSAPFNHSGTSPISFYMEPAKGIEPPTH